jgi:hypothetical protein
MDANSTGTGHTKSVTLSNAVYVSTFNCTDISGNVNSSENVTFTVNVAAVVTPVDSGSPGGSSGPSSVTTSDYTVTPGDLNLDVGIQTTQSQIISITNDGESTLNLSLKQKNLDNRVILPYPFVEVAPGETIEIKIVFAGLDEVGVFSGTISVGSKSILVSLNVEELDLLFDSNIVVLNTAYTIRQGEKLKTSVELIPMGDPARLDVVLNYEIKDYEDNIYLTRSESVLVEDRTGFDREFDTGVLPTGKYVIALELVYPNGVASSSAHFEVITLVPTTIFGKIVFYLVNLTLLVLIAIIAIIIRNLIPHIRKNS